MVNLDDPRILDNCIRHLIKLDLKRINKLGNGFTKKYIYIFITALYIYCIF